MSVDGPAHLPTKTCPSPLGPRRDGYVRSCRIPLADVAARGSTYTDDGAVEVVLHAFDLLEHTGDDLRELPLIERKRRLAKLLGRTKQWRASSSLNIWRMTARRCSRQRGGIDPVRRSLTGVRRAPSTVAAFPDDLIGQTSIIDGGTLEIHGITNERRADFKPADDSCSEQMTACLSQPLRFYFFLPDPSVGCHPAAAPFWLGAAPIVLIFSFLGFFFSRLLLCSPLAMSSSSG
jgi:hypothetical protein